MNLTKYENDGLELFINTDTGACFASISAVARMCDRPKSTISRYVNGQYKGVDYMQPLENFSITNGGRQKCKLLNEEQIIEVIARYNPSLLQACAKAGLRVYLHKLAGFKVSSEAVNHQQQEKQANSDKLPYEEADRVSNAIRNIIDNLYDNPIVAQILIDCTVNTFVQRHGIEPPKLDQVSYKGVVDIAEELGFKTNLSSRTLLGQFVKSSEVGHLAKREKRLVNGAMREINCYPDTPEIRQVIKDFFS